MGVLPKMGTLASPIKEFEEALRDRKYREMHRQALQHAYEEAGVTGVPMFVIGSQVLTELQDRETLEAVIEEELRASVNGGDAMATTKAIQNVPPRNACQPEAGR